MSITLKRQFIEAAGVGILENWCSRAAVTLARPNRSDTPVDTVAIRDEDLSTAPLQLKIVLEGGMTVHRKYVAHSALKIVYTLLGREAGGATGPLTRFVVLNPEQAWRLPGEMGLKYDPEVHETYRWPSTTRDLQASLAPFTAEDPEGLAQLLFS